ncbi:MAG: hypothetical protein H6940_00975 [Burkholderiales bacterium]|nr:hypothetical protein [Burkholderiales bacterium]
MKLFFTITLRDRKSTLLINPFDILREAMRKRENKAIYDKAWSIAGTYACSLDLATGRR